VVIIRPLVVSDRDWVGRYVRAHWGAPIVVVHGEVLRPDQLPGFVAEHDGECVGVVTYQIRDNACEIVSLDSDRPVYGRGHRPDQRGD
jgi:hypothetical protein